MTNVADAITRASEPIDSGVPTYRLSFPRVVRSEWIKLRSLRSTWATLAGVLGVLIGFGVIAASVVGKGAAYGQAGSAGRDPMDTVLAGANLAVLVVGVLGAVIGAREFASGFIRTTLAAVPKRLPVLWGKLLALSLVLVPAAVAGAVASFTAGMAVLDSRGHLTLAWSDPGVVRTVFGTAAYLVGIGLIGLALGVIVRETAGAIGLLAGGVLILPTLATALLPESWHTALKYLPSNAGSAFTSRVPDPTLLSPAAGAAVFTGWIAIAVFAAAILLRARDV